MAYRVQISANMLSWPRACACCGRAADAHIRATSSRTTGKRVRRTTTSWWEVPYCSACVKHKVKFESAHNWLVAGLVIGILAWPLIGVFTGNGIAGFLVGVLIFLVCLSPYNSAKKSALGLMNQECSTPWSAVRYIDWHGTFHTFIFHNRAYLDSFLVANNRKTRSDITRV